MKIYESPICESFNLKADDIIRTSTGDSPFIDGDDLMEPTDDLN